MKWRRDQSNEDSSLMTATAALSEMIAPEARSRLGEVLLSGQMLTPDQLSAALNLQQESGRQLGAILVEQGLVDPRLLTQALATQLGLPTIDLRRESPSDEALEKVPEQTARAFRIMPIRFIDDVLDVAVVDASNADVRDTLAGLKVSKVNVYLAPATDIDFALNTHYRVLTAGDDQVLKIWADSKPIEETIILDNSGDAPIIQLVNKIMAQAVRDRVSDIHVEPTEGRLRIRFRIDGALREALSLPASAGPELVSR
ncbi:MAG: hypothetical protein RLZZ623_1716, partial [Actinomycetota bacterium]